MGKENTADKFEEFLNSDWLKEMVKAEVDAESNKRYRERQTIEEAASKRLKTGAETMHATVGNTASVTPVRHLSIAYDRDARKAFDDLHIGGSSHKGYEARMEEKYNVIKADSLKGTIKHFETLGDHYGQNHSLSKVVTSKLARIMLPANEKVNNNDFARLWTYGNIGKNVSHEGLLSDEKNPDTQPFIANTVALGRLAYDKVSPLNMEKIGMNKKTIAKVMSDIMSLENKAGFGGSLSLKDIMSLLENPVYKDEYLRKYLLDFLCESSFFTPRLVVDKTSGEYKVGGDGYCVGDGSGLFYRPFNGLIREPNHTTSEKEKEFKDNIESVVKPDKKLTQTLEEFKEGMKCINVEQFREGIGSDEVTEYMHEVEVGTKRGSIDNLYYPNSIHKRPITYKEFDKNYQNTVVDEFAKRLSSNKDTINQL